MIEGEVKCGSDQVRIGDETVTTAFASQAEYLQLWIHNMILIYDWFQLDT